MQLQGGIFPSVFTRFKALADEIGTKFFFPDMMQENLDFSILGMSRVPSLIWSAFMEVVDDL